MAQALLTVNNIETFYGPIMAIRGVSFSVTAGTLKFSAVPAIGVSQ